MLADKEDEEEAPPYDPEDGVPAPLTPPADFRPLLLATPLLPSLLLHRDDADVLVVEPSVAAPTFR